MPGAMIARKLNIGSELCRQIAKMSPDALVLLGKGENSIYEIKSELQGKYKSLNIQPIIVDVGDKGRIHAIFAEVKPEVVPCGNSQTCTINGIPANRGCTK